MTEQSPEASIDSAKPDLPIPIIHKPDSRADVDRKKSAATPKRDRKYENGKKIRKKNSQDILEYVVHVVSARYDEEGQSWMYKLTDWEQKEISGETNETRLGLK